MLYSVLATTPTNAGTKYLNINGPILDSASSFVLFTGSIEGANIPNHIKSTIISLFLQRKITHCLRDAEMTEKKEYKTNPALVAGLTSGSGQRVLESLSELEKKGNPLYIPVLIDVLISTTSEQVRSVILDMLGNLKEKECIPHLISAIRDVPHESLRTELVSCCWKNSLDFSEHLAFFTDLVIESEFETAFEALTVIDNMGNLPSSEDRNIEIGKARHALQSSEGMQTGLLRELIAILTRPCLQDIIHIVRLLLK
jgi:hypothetical protein